MRLMVGNEFFQSPLGYNLACEFTSPEILLSDELPPLLICLPGLAGSAYSPSVEMAVDSARKNGIASFRAHTTDIKLDPSNPFGFHANTAHFTPHVLVEIIERAIQHAKKVHKGKFDENKTFICTASLGAFAAVTHQAQAESTKLAGLCLQSMVSDPLKAGREYLNFFTRLLWKWRGHIERPVCGEIVDFDYGFFTDCNDYDLARDAAPKIHAPLYIVHGTDDSLASCDDIAEFCQSLPELYRVKPEIITGVGHALEYTSKINELHGMSEEMLRGLVRNHRDINSVRQLAVACLLQNFGNEDYTAVSGVAQKTMDFIWHVTNQNRTAQELKAVA